MLLRSCIVPGAAEGFKSRCHPSVSEGHITAVVGLACHGIACFQLPRRVSSQGAIRQFRSAIDGSIDLPRSCWHCREKQSSTPTVVPGAALPWPRLGRVGGLLGIFKQITSNTNFRYLFAQIFVEIYPHFVARFLFRLLGSGSEGSPSIGFGWRPETLAAPWAHQNRPVVKKDAVCFKLKSGHFVRNCYYLLNLLKSSWTEDCITNDAQMMYLTSLNPQSWP